MLKHAYQRGVVAAIKQAQEEGLLGKITSWADENPSLAAGFFGRPALKTMQTVQKVDPEASRLRAVAQETLNSQQPSQHLYEQLLNPNA